MSKKFLSILLSAIMMFAICSIGLLPASAEEVPSEVTVYEDATPDESTSDETTNRYYFYMPDEWLNGFTEATGNTAGIYWWEGTDYHKEWPGVPANKADAEGVYYYDVPGDVAAIIWNNFVDGGADNTKPEYYNAIQTCNIGTEYYDPDESDFYPEGTDSFDGMIYVVDYSYYPYGDYTNKGTYTGEWFYYYGNGEYGTSPVKGESRVLCGDTIDLVALSESNNAGDEGPCPSLDAYYWGDANGDRRVNIKDATEIQKALADLVALDKVQTLAADVDADYEVNIKDATAIQKWLAGIDTETYRDDFIGRFWIDW